jgi:hypothetical protein
LAEREFGLCLGSGGHHVTDNSAALLAAPSVDSVQTEELAMNASSTVTLPTLHYPLGELVAAAGSDHIRLGF